jgi:hypothetical protein
MAPNRFFSAGSFPKDFVPFFRRGGGVMRGWGADRRKAASGGATLIAVTVRKSGSSWMLAKPSSHLNNWPAAPLN